MVNKQNLLNIFLAKMRRLDGLLTAEGRTNFLVKIYWYGLGWILIYYFVVSFLFLLAYCQSNVIPLSAKLAAFFVN